MRYLEFLALIPIAIFVFCYLAMILWIFFEGLVRAYFAFHDREYIPTWITRNFHILMILMAKISIPIIIMVWFFGGGDISTIILTLVICFSLIYTKPSALKIYNRDVNESAARDCQ